MKTYYTQDFFGTGRPKYTVRFHDGVTKNRDGSPFFNIQIIANKKNLGPFCKGLEQQGYVQQQPKAIPTTLVNPGFVTTIG